MSQALRSHLRQNVVAYLALFVALGGSSYAAIKLPARSVGNKQLRNSAVTKLKIKKGAISTDRLALRAVSNSRLGLNAVKGNNIADGSLTAKDLAPGQIPTPPAQLPTIVARARSTGAVNTSDGDFVDVPLTGNTWTQAANEVEPFYGQMVVDAPTTCSNSGGPATFTGLLVEVRLDGVIVQPAGFAQSLTGQGRVTIPVASGITRFEPGAATPHQLAIRVKDNCATAGQNYTVQSASIDVGSLR